MQEAQQGNIKRCGAKIRSCGGQCGECGWKGERGVRHGGKCEQCGSAMLCMSQKMNGANRCRMHGGKSRKSGPGHHSYKHGKESKLQKNLGIHERAKEAMNNPELMDLRYDAAILSEIIQEVLSGDRLIAVEDIRGAFEGLKLAMSEGDDSKVQDLMDRLGRLVASASKAMNSVGKIERLIARRSQTVATERRLQIQQGMMVSAAAVSHGFNRLVTVVANNAAGCPHCGGKTLSAIRSEYELLVGAAPESIE